MKKVGIVLAVICILLCGMVVFAEGDVTIQASLDVADFYVDIQAAGLPAFSRVVLLAVPEGTTAETVLGAGKPAYIEQTEVGTNGKIVRHVAFADDAKPGMYVIYAVSGEIGESGQSYQSAPFRYLIGEETQPALERLNHADKDGMKDALTGCDVSIALDMTEYNALSPEEQGRVAEMLCSVRPTGGFANPKAVHDAFGACVAAVALPSSDQPLALLEKYANALGIKFSLLAQCTGGEKDAAAAFLQQGSYATPKELTDAFRESVFVGKVRCAGTAGDIQLYFLNTFADALHLDLTQYRTLTYANQVFSALYHLRDTIVGFEDAKTKFAAAVGNQANAEASSVITTPGGGVGGGGGAGGAGGGGVGGASGYPASTDTSAENSGANKPQNTLYSDLEGVAWATEAVALLTERGIVTGDGNGRFRPNDFVTRAEFLKMLLITVGVSEADATTAFEDVAATDWYASYVAAGVKNGIVKGISQTRFGADETITREDLTVMCLRAATVIQMHFADMRDGEPKDAALVSDYARDAVNRFYRAGIVNGDTDGAFRPQSGATRAEAAKIIAGLLHQKEAMN